MASHVRRHIRGAFADSAYAVARMSGDLATYQYRDKTALSVYVQPLGEAESVVDGEGIEADEKAREFTLSSAQGGIRARVINKALTSNVVTLTTLKAHGFVAGQEIRVVMDDADAAIDGLSYTITSVPSATTLRYSNTAGDVASIAAGGDIEAILRPGDTLKHESEEYSIATITPDQYRAVYRLACVSRRARHLGTGV